MTSQLAAALLGHNAISNPVEDDDKDEPDEEADDVDEFIDEEFDADSGNRAGKSGPAGGATSRVVTLQMLLSADILQPGDGTMSIEYLGQRFIGDLLVDGKIKSQETDIVFASPSAWAIHCKRIINPEKKSGCGWASVKYKGKKLDAYKNIWYKKKKQEEMQDKADETSDNEMETEQNDSKAMPAPQPLQRIVVKHNTIANRTFTHDSNTLVECVPFSNLGKIQPFLISMSTNAVLVMDLHCHLTLSEVSGYLAGQWDVNGHNLTITHAFPCRCTKADKDLGPQVEMEIQKEIEKQQLILVGWYHSHPSAPAAPTLRDIDSQLEYQIRMKGSSDSSYIPCVGLICSPYNQEYTSLESAIIAYWVIPPPESKPNEYGRPMLMSYSVVQDSVLASPAMEEMKKCAEYYKKERTFVNFADRYQHNTTYLEKLKTTLSSKFPRDQNDGVLWGFIKEIIGYSGDDKIDTSALLSVPNLSVKPPTCLPSLSSASSLTSNLMLTSNLANVLFSSGKFPSHSSLLGLPDPMAQSTLAANNMFLSPNLFKMQDTLNLLKPLSTSSPIPSTSKSDQKMKKSAELKTHTLDFTTDLNLLTLKNKLDFGLPDLSMPKSNFNAADLSISSVRPQKIDFSASDLSISSVNTSAKSKTNDSFGLDATIKNFMAQTMEAPPAKIPKTDYSMLDLSIPSSKASFVDSLFNTGDLSSSHGSKIEADQPLNLAE